MEYLNSEIIQVGMLVIKISISLNSKSKNGDTIPAVSSYNNGKTYNYKITTGLVFEIKSFTEEWDKKNSIYIFPDEIIYVLSMLKRIYFLITHERTVTFGIDGENNIFLKDKKANILSHVFRARGDMIVTPFPIKRMEDTKEVTLYGIKIGINDLFKTVELDDYQLATVITTLEKLDLFVYSNMVINNTISLMNIGMCKKSQNINVPSKPDENSVKRVDSVIIKKESDEEFFNFK